MKSSEPLRGFTAERQNTLGHIPPLPGSIAEALQSGRLSHAVCLESTSAARRRDTALALAGAVLCGKGRAMCGSCLTCRKVLAGAHADVTVCDPETNKDVYKVANLRTLRSEAFRRPVEADCKVIVLHLAERISTEGQNILLKIIEEPPEDTLFLFTCASRHRLLGTVQSRVTVYPLPALSDTECMAALQQLVPDRTGDEYGKALIRCAGSPETGAALLTDAAVQKRYAVAEEMMAGLAMGSAYRVIAAAAPMEKDRAAYTALLETLAELLANDTLRRIYNLAPRTAAAYRGEIAPLLQMCERNAHLPLVSALLAKRCRKN